MEIGPDHEAEREIPRLDIGQNLHIILVSSISQVVNLSNKECASEAKIVPGGGVVLGLGVG